MNYFAFFIVGAIVGGIIFGLVFFIFFISKITKYKNFQLKNKFELERYRNEFKDKYIDDGYEAY